MEVHESSTTLEKYWQILKRRGMPAILMFCSVLFLAQFAASLKKPTYVSEGKLRFRRTNTTSSLTGLGTEIGKLDPIIAQSNPLTTEAEVIRSVPVIQRTISQINLKDNQGNLLTTKEFLQGMTVREVRGADVLQISYKDIDPQISAKVVNTLMAVYLEENIASLRAETVAASKFIEKQVPMAELVVRRAEADLANFKQKNQVITLEEEGIKAVEILADLQKQINTTQSQIANVDSQSQALRQQLGMNSQQAVTTTSLNQIPGVQNLLTEIQQLESQLIDRRTVLQDTHPQIIDLEDKLNSLNKLLEQRIQQVTRTNTPQPVNTNFQLGELQQQTSARLAELESTRQGLESQAAALFKSQVDYQLRLNNMPKLEQQQRQLERKVQAAQSTYLLMLQRLQESRIAENQNVGNANIISPAEPPEQPVSSAMVSYLSAALLAFLAALATVYILETRDKSIKTVDEAKELLGLTVLGMIPFFNTAKKTFLRPEEPELYYQRLVVRDFPRSSISEAYRMLRANLTFISADKELKVTVITSSVSSEGKSTVAANLAVAVAQMESKVLLIDADLHHPVQHKIWKLTNNQGLSNLIVGQSEVSIAVKKVMDNLDVLTSGSLPPSPASLLDSKKMAMLIENFADNYDFVIIDTPSLNVAADAATLGQMADGVFLVVRPEVVNAVNATFAKEVLEKSGQNILGQIVNGVIPQNELHNYYYVPQKEHSEQTQLISS
ncbi:GumC family protein [Nodularia sphaerocarpa]|uniref:GumC family protein n=1 Tax=Nodularia sphaerocarpa TaxID=137816 RepID=UPI001EFBBDBA|nr:polysaccharide biosynthesis tyrosine autokinase [Nodularia sphaerocarpa]MDB9374343.1 polysaccharide biosynthesis tyrosine autokinase [Nodularia sphaerocarpa CS-585]MDB9379252.1 polysaccharide biosynthesis tyrosine autokinase [Nodularia sphaerocarpa CS-585A2]ULP70399.1 Tyrosine-protein kinase etk [Nodularia sphaerocarpa UHCC 0038]